MFIKQNDFMTYMYSLHSQPSFSSSSTTVSNDSTFTSNSSSDFDDDDIYSDIIGQYFDGQIAKVKKEHNTVTQVIEDEAYCFNVTKFAEKLVDATFIEANKILTYKKETIRPENIPCNTWSQNDSEESISTLSALDSISMHWPKISEFNIKLGMEKVEQFVGEWERSNDWKFCVEFVGFECEDCSNIFVFQVEWSKPNKSYPIPQATANVFFALDVFKMVPYNYHSRVEVTYIFECSTVIHRPGRIDFQEKWLEDIIEAKLRFFKTITFSNISQLVNKRNECSNVM